MRKVYRALFALLACAILVNGDSCVTPSRLIFSRLVGIAATDPQAVTVIDSDGDFNVNAVNGALQGGAADQFQMTQTNATGNLQFQVAFKPTGAGLKNTTLQLTAPGFQPVQVQVRGLGAAGEGGAGEPSLQRILDLFEIPLNVGDDDPDTALINSDYAKARLPLLGPDEIPAQKLQRADPTKEVTIELLAVYGPGTAQGTVSFGWYASGDVNSAKELFAVDNNDHHGQMVNPPFTGTNKFTPTAEPFGFYSSWPFFQDRKIWQEDNLNTFAGALPHHMRVYPMRTPDGQNVPNTYVITTEEYTAAFDFQDILVIVHNVKPAAAGQQTRQRPTRFNRRADAALPPATDCPLSFIAVGNTNNTASNSNSTRSTATNVNTQTQSQTNFGGNTQPTVQHDDVSAGVCWRSYALGVVVLVMGIVCLQWAME